MAALNAMNSLMRGHVDAVTVRDNELVVRRIRYDNLFGIQLVQNLDDALFQRGTANNGVVNDDQVVFERRVREPQVTSYTWAAKSFRPPC